MTSCLAPRAGSKVRIPKLGSSKAIRKRNWVVGTGVHMDDPTTIFRNEVVRDALRLSPLLVLLLL